ncbi:hypothetical protein [Shewanella sp. 6_MG-2023]|uniref:hypothetical protein n=1 Tax=Shewanella sp. 6_MG-2023 TaxID=3062660 RepID=UPI0026E2413F|nr:hypothetical protein [Shewanella sp. 6_MG-2023]MDO6619835.1 hypothetical protein [Shewanella sp. 6_MG-2023]
MEKSAFLDAMGVTRWRSADSQGKPYLIIHDDGDDISQHSLVKSVLSLLHIDESQCEFDTEMVKGMQVIWDLRKMRVRPRVAWIITDPIEALLQGHQGKRDLWQQLGLQLDKTASIDTDKSA